MTQELHWDFSYSFVDLNMLIIGTVTYVGCCNDHAHPGMRRWVGSDASLNTTIAIPFAIPGKQKEAWGEHDTDPWLCIAW